jgi:acetolactate synthase-1/2/3 large subunit
VVLVVDRRIPWVPAGTRPGTTRPDDPTDMPLGDPAGAPGADCRIAWLGEDPGVFELPIMELAGDLRIQSDPTIGLRLLADAIEDRIDAAGRGRASERIEAGRGRKRELRERYDRDAGAAAGRTPIDPRWLAYQLGRITDQEAILLDESLSNASMLRRYHHGDRPASFFAQGGSGGGWGSGAAIGAKLAEPDRDVILAAGDGFYGFGNPTQAIWTAIRYHTPYLAVVFVNASFSTGKNQVIDFYGEESYSKASGFEGGVFDPPPDFAAEARAAGAHGEYVDDPHVLEEALARGLDASRNGQPAVVAVRIS